jgi:hypothetical protein
VQRVQIAAAQLEHQLGLLDDRLRRDHQHPRGDVVDGTTSRISFGDTGRTFWPFSAR